MTATIDTVDIFHIPSAKHDANGWWKRKPYILIRIACSDGVIGWGEAHVLNRRERTVIAAIKDFSVELIGHNAHDIRAVSHGAFELFGEHRAGIDIYCAMAGVETALWDAQGKRLGQPVYRLLGGSVRDEIAVYANIFSPHAVTPDMLAAQAVDQVEMGYKAIKAYPFLGSDSVDQGIAKLKAVRDAIGPDIILAVDLWRHADLDRALSFSRLAEPYNLAFLEDPFAPTNATALRTLRERSAQPVLTGETLCSRQEFREIFEAHAVSLINPDICATGILEMQAIASMAEPYMIRVSPHNSNSMSLGTSIMLHAVAGIPNLGLCEYFPIFETAMDDLCDGRPVVRNGMLDLPSAPGFGITFNESRMQRFRVNT